MLLQGISSSSAPFIQFWEILSHFFSLGFHFVDDDNISDITYLVVVCKKWKNYFIKLKLHLLSFSTFLSYRPEKNSQLVSTEEFVVNGRKATMNKFSFVVFCKWKMRREKNSMKETFTSSRTKEIYEFMLLLVFHLFQSIVFVFSSWFMLFSLTTAA